ncbi:11555_t:CDS:2, partial [Racocetra persica]
LISLWFGLRLEKSLLISSVRCIVQLTIMGLVLADVFRMGHPAVVLGMILYIRAGIARDEHNCGWNNR